MPADATTAAAIAPSTSGASTSRIEPLPLGALLEHGAGGQDRAAEVAEHDRAVALVGGGDRGLHARAVGAEPAVRRAAGGLDADLRSGHLRGERGGAGGDLRAVRHDYDPDHRASLNYRSRFDNAERK